ncbi:unnamed protein product [Heligmosomoides polygyrus]|uniref:Protein pellino n=1 Tax=Heligmosomoides polygyrus TaxID=6339 RepID=A0A183G702_HELPZ|nr:unnamed protein product [Heligmosomoides polygyrus]
MSAEEHDGVSIDSRDIENAHIDVSDKSEIIMTTNTTFEDDDGKYGELILLGYNGSQDSKASVPLKRHRTKMTLTRRKTGNGIKKGSVSQVNVAAKDAPAVLDKNRHVVSYSYSKNQTVLVEYVADPFKDMFQIGRSSEEQIDFTIVDTWLASGSQLASSSGGSAPSRARASTDPHKMISSTISRYACRIIIDRENYDKAFLYAAGFDSVKNIFLGEKATKWMKKNGEMDGLTTNGILILHPNRNTEELPDDDMPPMYVWREVSVDGDIYTLRETRSSNARGALVPEETNMLQVGSPSISHFSINELTKACRNNIHSMSYLSFNHFTRGHICAAAVSILELFCKKITQPIE